MYVYIYWPIYIYCHICPLTYKTFPYKQIWTGDVQAQPVFFSVFKGKKLMKYYANAKLMQINIVETKINFGPREGLDANLKLQMAIFQARNNHSES